VSDEAQSLKASVKAKDNVPFVLRRGRPHELDLLAILSTEAFTPKGKWCSLFFIFLFFPFFLPLLQVLSM